MGCWQVTFYGCCVLFMLVASSMAATTTAPPKKNDPELSVVEKYLRFLEGVLASMSESPKEVLGLYQLGVGLWMGVVGVHWRAISSGLISMPLGFVLGAAVACLVGAQGRNATTLVVLTIAAAAPLCTIGATLCKAVMGVAFLLEVDHGNPLRLE